VLVTLRRSLQRHGFEVLLCESGEEALAQLGALGEPALPQVVLSDHRMQGMDGVTFLAQVRARFPTIQRVLITGFADLDAIERAVNEAGISRFLNKPWEDVNLLSTVRSALEQWQVRDENRRLLAALEDHNRRLEETVAERTQALVQATQRLALADRLAAIGQLAGGVAHEINNPLSGILAFAQLLLRDLQAGTLDPGEELEFLGEIEAAALRCKKIVEHLLRFSRQAQRDEVRPLSLNVLVEEAVPLIEHQYAVRGVRLRCTLDPALPEVSGSGARLQQVLLTLLSNAFDATLLQKGGGGGGQIEVTTRALPGAAQLIVRDEGPGIDADSRPRLFSPFFSTKPEGRGAGLGLAVSYGIVTEHRGTIEARDAAAGGAEFTVTLPALAPGA
jgi:signal transduction histidine kinase